MGMSTKGQSDQYGTTKQDPGFEQVAHFVKQGAKLVRLPFGWQYMQKDLKGKLDDKTFPEYDKYVQEVLKLGGYPIIDVHNYARRDDKIIGQGGPTDEDFADLWGKLASKYSKNPNVIFGIVNEPHDLDMKVWAKTCQTIVNTIRKTGATSNIILLPGDGYTGLGAFPNWYNDMKDIKNPDGSNDNLLFEMHIYFDSDFSGQNNDCVTNQVPTLQKAQQLLAKEKRKALITEFGGGNNDECVAKIGEFVKILTESPDEFPGFTVWAAGAFKTDQRVQVTPTGDKDALLWEKAIKPHLNNDDFPFPRSAKLESVTGQR